MLKGYYQPCFVDLVINSNFKKWTENYTRTDNVSFAKIPAKYRTAKPYHKYIYFIKSNNKYIPAGLFGSKPEPDNYSHVIPGNGPTCPTDIGDIIRLGKVFWWNKWHVPPNNWKTHILLGDHTTGAFDLMLITDLPAGDIRVVNINDDLYYYDTSLLLIHKINSIGDYSIDDSTIKCMRDFKDKLTDKNLVLTDIIMDADNTGATVQFLNWFYNTGVKSDIYYIDGINLQQYYSGSITTPISSYVINANYQSFDTAPFNNGLYFNGNGSTSEDPDDGSINWGITPLMSFGTPLVKYGDLYIGVGHLKIHSNTFLYNYLADSNIDKFRTYIAEYMNDTYGDRYIQHFGTDMVEGECHGYLYLIFFYVLTCDYDLPPPLQNIKRWKSMHISDGYLPLSNEPIIDKKYDRDYKFSLWFPMGLVLEDKKLTVSAGYGDYYSAFLEYNVDEVVESCRHDANNLDFNSYEYHLDILPAKSTTPTTPIM